MFYVNIAIYVFWWMWILIFSILLDEAGHIKLTGRHHSWIQPFVNKCFWVYVLSILNAYKIAENNFVRNNPNTYILENNVYKTLTIWETNYYKFLEALNYIEGDDFVLEI